MGRGKLDTAGVTIGCPDTAVVTSVAIEEDVALAVDRTKIITFKVSSLIAVNGSIQWLFDTGMESRNNDPFQ